MRFFDPARHEVNYPARHNDRVEYLGACTGCAGETPLMLGERDKHTQNVLVLRELKKSEAEAR